MDLGLVTWSILCLLLLPVSVLYDVYAFVRTWIIFQINSSPKGHEKKVKHVQAQVRQWAAGGREKKMCTSRPWYSSLVFRRTDYKAKLHQINVNMIDIINLDVDKRTLFVEPFVTMGQITSILEPLGWTLPVLPEFNNLTVGGLVMGSGIETSSYKYGLFQDICLSYELVLGDGEKVTCSKDEKSDLFYSVPWSYGTVGFLTGIQLQIIPANRFVKVDYLPAHTLEEFTHLTELYAKKTNENDFLEAILFSKTEGVVMVGNMVTSAEPGKLNRIGLWYKPFFARYVEEFLRKGKSVEYIPLREYYHRHSKGAFWCMTNVIPIANHPIFRYLAGWMAPINFTLTRIVSPQSVFDQFETNYILQDMFVPLGKLKETVQVVDDLTKVYPLWVCPINLKNKPGLVHPVGGQDQFYVDVGVYGVPVEESAKNRAPATVNKLEKYVIKVNGFQMLYTHSFMSKEEHQQMFDHSLYNATRKKYKCEEAFPTMADKVLK